jgi:hypothetical protein
LPGEAKSTSGTTYRSWPSQFVVIVLVKAVPVYGVSFEQQYVVPPAQTQAIFAFSEHCSVYFVRLLCVGMVIDAAVVFMLGFAFHKRRWLLAPYLICGSSLRSRRWYYDW